MKIAMLAPSPIPYTIGGAENLAWSLCENLNQKSSHQVELIKVPVREDNFWNVIKAYHTFYTMDLSHFDVVICSKYPAWMIRHPNCLYYVLHCLRGLYDTYHFTRQPLEVEKGNVEIDKIVEYIQLHPNPEDLDEFFELLFALEEKEGEIPPEYFAFPGPFIRAIVHYMDSFGLGQNRPPYYYAISKTVKNRTEYFPQGAEVKVIYPPISLKEYKTGEYKHIFMVSRLDNAKRIDLLIQAMKLVKSDVKLYIAGTGPQEAELKELAKDDPRIEFVGFVTNQEVDDYYANCLVVPYFPHEEDYGLITIEAMKHKKPVITTTDAGGPTEFVVNGETGFVVDVDAMQIAEKIDYLAKNTAAAQEMGEKAYQKVQDINWDNAVRDMVEAFDIQQQALTNSRPQITVSSTFSVWPPMGGGQARIFGLYQQLAKQYDVELICFSANESTGSRLIAPGLRETKLPKGAEHLANQRRIDAKLAAPAEGIANLAYCNDTPHFVKQLQKSYANSKLAVVTEPYTWNLVKQAIGNTPFIYEALNVEIILKDAILSPGPGKQEALDLVRKAERECCEKSLFIMVCSQEDKDKLVELYDVSAEKITIVPNGVNSKETHFTTQDQRRLNKLKMGLANEKIALFMGSWHGPNLEAAAEIIKLAPQCPGVKFMLLGSQCAYFKNKPLPANVALLGKVTEKQKHTIFATVDFALNPMRSGSGTNLKMFDYMAAGLPVITTEFGTRGIERKDLFTIADTTAELLQAIEEFTLEKEDARIPEARKYVEQEFDWKPIAAKVAQKIESVLYSQLN
ncbi:glycosyltransferase family 4 protein [Ruminococcaceae bacterium OttesenSCG-928-A16]|nr:glycosyltransferase family 4 protein [Ruminococcaceae bacterium OttesenSCG-928-A16]